MKETRTARRMTRQFETLSLELVAKPGPQISVCCRVMAADNHKEAQMGVCIAGKGKA